MADSKFSINHLICHTGQHYDEKMNDVFLGERELPKPALYFGISICSNAELTAKIMVEFEKVLNLVSLFYNGNLVENMTYSSKMNIAAV